MSTRTTPPRKAAQSVASYNLSSSDLSPSEPRRSPRKTKRKVKRFDDEDDDHDYQISDDYTPTKRKHCEKVKTNSKLIKQGNEGTDNFSKPDVESVEATTSAQQSSRLKDGEYVKLSAEIHYMILSNLSDKDVITYSCLCKELSKVVGSKVWHDRFKCTFDIPMLEGDRVDILAKKYKFRLNILNKPTNQLPWRQRWSPAWSKSGLSQMSKMHLEMLRSLIIDSNATLRLDENGKLSVFGLNHEQIRQFCQPRKGDGSYCDIIEDIFDFCVNFETENLMHGRGESAFALVIYLCLAHIALSPKVLQTVRRFDDSQRMMYVEHQHNTIFQGKYKRDLNIRWLVHAVNYWRLHLTIKHEGILASDFSSLSMSQRPQPWLTKLQPGTQKLGKHWKGAYLHISPRNLDNLRNGYDQISQDELDGGETFQEFAFFFDDKEFPASDWPSQFENVLRCNPFEGSKQHDTPPVKTEQFYGIMRGSNEADECYFFGGLHALPSQQMICGFQRMALIKFVPTDSEGYSSAWAYEGCVLPGGRIIVGQWWAIEYGFSLSNSGPFVLWNVDETGTVLNGGSALAFYKSLDELVNWL